MLNNPPVEYYRTKQDGKIQLWSKVATDFGGPAHNFIAERDTDEEIDELEARLKSLAR